MPINSESHRSRTLEGLERIVYAILTEAQGVAALRNCFTEADATSLDDPERHW
jgi:hypothetical protein